MKREMGLAMPSETGGVFAGRVNFKTKTIHVTELIKAPSDSKGNAACFFRGVEGLPAKIAEISVETVKRSDGATFNARTCCAFVFRTTDNTAGTINLALTGTLMPAAHAVCYPPASGFSRT